MWIRIRDPPWNKCIRVQVMINSSRFKEFDEEMKISSLFLSFFRLLFWLKLDEQFVDNEVFNNLLVVDH